MTSVFFGIFSFLNVKDATLPLHLKIATVHTYMWNVIIANIRSEMSRYFACTTFTSNLFRCTERKGAREKHSSEVIAMLKNGFPLVRHWIPCLGLEYFVNPRFVFARTNTKRSSLNDPAPNPHLTECNLNHFP